MQHRDSMLRQPSTGHEECKILPTFTSWTDLTFILVLDDSAYGLSDHQGRRDELFPNERLVDEVAEAATTGRECAEDGTGVEKEQAPPEQPYLLLPVRILDRLGYDG